jgi:glycosyltransferase involved in cell wall biosynthesis
VDLFTGPVDVCHFPDFTLPPLRNGKTVLTVHDLSFLVYPEYAEKGLRQYLERVVPPSVAGASLVLADSASTRNDLMVLLDVPPDRVQVLLAGVDPRFAPVVDEATLESTRRKYGINFPYILTISTIEPRKNLIGLMKAFSLLKKTTDSRHKLVIGGGKGWLYQEIFAAAKAIDVADDIIFLGYVAEEDLPALYTMADLFGWVSFYEGFGLPVLEAMACGTPVVGSNRASLPEVMGKAGLLVPPEDIEAIADAFGSILGNEQLAAELAKKGREQARLFSWRSTAEQLLSIYHRLASNS